MFKSSTTNMHSPQLQYFNEAAKVAKLATCQRSQCGAVIVSIDMVIIGYGFNSPPNNLESQRRCQNQKSSYHRKVTDKTCCIHAEQRAMFDALAKHPREIKGSTIYFVRLDTEGKIKASENPYCTICSKMALDLGVKYFGLFHKNGPVLYETEEYNQLSYDYSSV